MVLFLWLKRTKSLLGLPVKLGREYAVGDLLFSNRGSSSIALMMLVEDMILGLGMISKSWLVFSFQIRIRVCRQCSQAVIEPISLMGSSRSYENQRLHLSLLLSIEDWIIQFQVHTSLPRMPSVYTLKYIPTYLSKYATERRV